MMKYQRVETYEVAEVDRENRDEIFRLVSLSVNGSINKGRLCTNSRADQFRTGDFVLLDNEKRISYAKREDFFKFWKPAF